MHIYYQHQKYRGPNINHLLTKQSTFISLTSNGPLFLKPNTICFLHYCQVGYIISLSNFLGTLLCQLSKYVQKMARPLMFAI